MLSRRVPHGLYNKPEERSYPLFGGAPSEGEHVGQLLGRMGQLVSGLSEEAIDEVPRMLLHEHLRYGDSLLMAAVEDGAIKGHAYRRKPPLCDRLALLLGELSPTRRTPEEEHALSTVWQSDQLCGLALRATVHTGASLLQ